eukprot:NODE_31_length_37178_cov_0.413576.p3 type:complete len:730 gc:universal NODE_31_length_37178_cov_0.413576:27942-25753(-)
MIVLLLVVLSYTSLLQFDFPGQDIYSINTATLSKCQLECDYLNHCLGFVFITNSSTCTLKFKMSKRLYSSVSTSYFKYPNVTNITNVALQIPGWILDENIELSPNVRDYPYSSTNQSDVLLRCTQSNNCIAASLNYGVYALYGNNTNPGNSDLYTKSLVGSYFEAIQGNISLNFSPNWFTQNYTRSICLTECFHEPDCKFALFSELTLKCALLATIDKNDIVLVTFETEFSLFNKTFQFDKAISFMHGFNTTQQESSTINTDIVQCQSMSKNLGKSALYSDETKTCKLYSSFDVNQIVPSNRNDTLLISNSNYKFLPNYRRRNPYYYNEPTKSSNLSVLMDYCSSFYFCSHVLLKHYKERWLSGVNLETELVALEANTYSVIKRNQVKPSNLILQPNLLLNYTGINKGASQVIRSNQDLAKCANISFCDSINIYNYNNDYQNYFLTNSSQLSISSIRGFYTIYVSAVKNQFVQLLGQFSTTSLETTSNMRLHDCLNRCYNSVNCDYAFCNLIALTCTLSKTAINSTYFSFNAYTPIVEVYRKDISKYDSQIKVSQYGNVNSWTKKNTQEDCFTQCSLLNSCITAVYDSLNQTCGVSNSQIDLVPNIRFNAFVKSQFTQTTSKRSYTRLWTTNFAIVPTTTQLQISDMETIDLISSDMVYEETSDTATATNTLSAIKPSTNLNTRGAEIIYYFLAAVVAILIVVIVFQKLFRLPGRKVRPGKTSQIKSGT